MAYKESCSVYRMNTPRLEELRSLSSKHIPKYFNQHFIVSPTKIRLTNNPIFKTYLTYILEVLMPNL